jgi:Rrf2 family transcriptional regulator, iron-sulfur cluster assembly transcription factor
MFSKAVEYSIRSVIFLTNQNKKVDVKTISDELKIPRHFIAKLLQTLTKNGILKSTKGINGGFEIVNTNTTITDLIIAIDGNLDFDKCSLGLPTCDDKKPCPLHSDIKEVKKLIRERILSKTLYDISKDNKLLKYFIC